jgi:hypothetical protein
MRGMVLLRGAQAPLDYLDLLLWRDRGRIRPPLGGASVFWLRRLAALGDEEAAIEHWQIKRDGTRRDIVEVAPDDPQ